MNRCQKVGVLACPATSGWVHLRMSRYQKAKLDEAYFPVGQVHLRMSGCQKYHAAKALLDKGQVHLRWQVSEVVRRGRDEKEDWVRLQTKQASKKRSPAPTGH